MNINHILHEASNAATVPVYASPKPCSVDFFHIAVLLLYSFLIILFVYTERFLTHENIFTILLRMKKCRLM